MVFVSFLMKHLYDLVYVIDRNHLFINDLCLKILGSEKMCFRPLILIISL
jgi:hypothetical protein